MRRELAALAYVTDLPVPAPMHMGQPDGRFPWPFWGCRWLPGVEATSATDADRHLLAPQLGHVLRRLHMRDVPNLPVDVVRRADMAFRVPLVRAELAAAAELWHPTGSAFALLDEAE